MDGAALRYERQRRDIWFGAMLPNLEKVPSLEEFATGKRDSQADIAKCIAAWDAVDRALAMNQKKPPA